MKAMHIKALGSLVLFFALISSAKAVVVTVVDVRGNFEDGTTLSGSIRFLDNLVSDYSITGHFNYTNNNGDTFPFTVQPNIPTNPSNQPIFGIHFSALSGPPPINSDLILTTFGGPWYEADVGDRFDFVPPPGPFETQLNFAYESTTDVPFLILSSGEVEVMSRTIPEPSLLILFGIGLLAMRRCLCKENLTGNSKLRYSRCVLTN